MGRRHISAGQNDVSGESWRLRERLSCSLVQSGPITSRTNKDSKATVSRRLATERCRNPRITTLDAGVEGLGYLGFGFFLILNLDKGDVSLWTMI